MPEETPDMFKTMQENLGTPTPPAAPEAPAAPPAPPAPTPEQVQDPAKILNPDQYKEYKAAGWTDDQLREGGYAVEPFAPEPKPEPAKDKPAAPKKPRGRPQKSARVKMLEACASGGLTIDQARQYLEAMEE